MDGVIIKLLIFGAIAELLFVDVTIKSFKNLIFFQQSRLVLEERHRNVELN